MATVTRSAVSSEKSAKIVHQGQTGIFRLGLPVIVQNDFFDFELQLRAVFLAMRLQRRAALIDRDGLFQFDITGLKLLNDGFKLWPEPLQSSLFR